VQHAALAGADVLLASSTVRESIMIAALLKLPRGMAYVEKVERVEAILKELVSGLTFLTSFSSAACINPCTYPCRVPQLWPAATVQGIPACSLLRRLLFWIALQDLEGCQHTLIGDELLQMKGISGGQRRRVSGACRGWGHRRAVAPLALQGAAC
jgi:hypothetical protein